MPGTFTHFMVVERALQRYREAHGARDPLAITLQRRFPFALQGAISPDYPFVAERLPPPFHVSGNWGARMHFENTGAVIDHGLHSLAQREGDDHDICKAWLFGFATHLVADALVHPVVNLAVGGTAQFTDALQGVCEVTQDTWLFHEVTGNEIVDGDYVQQLKDCSDRGNPERIHPAVRGFWRQCLVAAHPAAGADLDLIAPDSWHHALLHLLPIAAHPTDAVKCIGRLVGLQRLIYRPTTELDPEHVRDYVEALRIPDGRGGVEARPLVTVIHRVVSEVVRRWEEMERRLADPNDVTSFPNWDLDTGVLIPTWNLDGEVHLAAVDLWNRGELA